MSPSIRLSTASIFLLAVTACVETTQPNFDDTPQFGVASTDEVSVRGHLSGTYPYSHWTGDWSVTIQASGEHGVAGGAKGNVIFHASAPILDSELQRVAGEVTCIEGFTFTRRDGTAGRLVAVRARPRNDKTNYFFGGDFTLYVQEEGTGVVFSHPIRVQSSTACTNIGGIQASPMPATKGKVTLVVPGS